MTETPVDPAAIETLRRLLAEATPEPWLVKMSQIVARKPGHRGGYVVCDVPNENFYEANGRGSNKYIKEIKSSLELIAHLRNLAPALLDERQRLIDRIAALEQENAPKLSLSLERDPLAISALLDENQQERELKDSLLLDIMRAIPDGVQIPQHQFADEIRRIVADHDSLRFQLTAAEQGATALREALLNVIKHARPAFPRSPFREALDAAKALFPPEALSSSPVPPSPEEHSYFDVEMAVAELKAAGWIEITHTRWQAPDGSQHLGPAGAYRKMKAAQKAGER